MAGGEGHEQAVSDERQRDQLRFRRTPGDQTGVEGEIENAGQDRLGVADGEADLHAGIAPLEAVEQVADVVGAGRAAGPDPQMPGLQFGHTFQRIARGVHQVEDSLGKGRQRLPGLGRCDPPPVPLKEPQAQCALQPADLLRHRRLGDPQVLGGGRETPMALTHEIIRQRIGRLTVVGCNLSIGMDQLVAAGLVRRTESGSGNLERFGVTFCWRRAIENGSLEVEDYSHLAMVSRFLAGEMGAPFMPTRSLLGSDLLPATGEAGKAVVIENPWNPGERVALVPALQPEVSLVHVQRADPSGNIIIEGFATHEPEMIRASHHVIISCEELVSTEEIRAHPERTTIPFLYVDAVVVQPYGAYPTSTYGHYDYDAAHVAAYQEAAREGSPAVDEYLRRYVWGCATFDEYLALAAGSERLIALRRAMEEML